MSIREFSVLMMICLIWGLHFIVMKVTVDGATQPLFYAAVRMTIVAIILLPKLKWHGPTMKLLLPAGLAYGALNYAFMFPALKFTTASAAAVSIELFVPFSIILSVIFLKDKVGIFRVLGIALAFIGVAIVASAGPAEAAGPYFLLGVLMIVCAAMSEAIGAILVKKISGVRPVEILAWFAVVGTLVLWPLSFLLEDNQFDVLAPETRLNFLWALTYSALLVSIVAHSSYYWLLQRLPMYIVSTSGLMTTLVAVISSVLILGEPVNLQLVVGGVMTLGGVGLILWRNKVKPKAPAPLPQ